MKKIFSKFRIELNYDEKFHIKTLSRFLVIAIIPCVLFSGFFYWQLRKVIDEQNTVFMEYFRKEQAEKIKGFYDKLQVQLAGYSNDFTPYLTGETQNDISISKWNKSEYIENVYLFDGSFNPLKIIQQNIQVSQDDACTSLKSIKFTTPSYVGSFFIKDNKAYQYYYYKIVINRSVKGYIAYILNTDFLDKYLDGSTGSIKTEVLDGNFNVLYSYDMDRLYKTDISTITKKMLDGNTSTEILNGDKNSYTYINLNDSSLYLNVYEKQGDIYSKVGSIVKYMMFITVIIFIGAIVLGWRYIGELKSFMQNYAGTREYSRRMRIFDNLEDYMDEVEDIADQLMETNYKICGLKDGIGSIRKKMHSEESESNVER